MARFVTMSEYRLIPARAHRKVRRTGAPLADSRKRVLHDAVLERVVADDRDPAARSEPRDRRATGLFERVELAVDLDSQSLEGPLGGVRPRTGGPRPAPRP